MSRVGWETRKVVRVSPFGTNMRKRMKSTKMRSLEGPSAMVDKRPTVFEDSHGVLLVERARTIRLNRRRLGVTSVQDTIGFGHVRTTSRLSEGLTLDETHNFDVVSWTGTTCQFVKVLVICVRIMLL